MNDLLSNIDKIHTTELGVVRIKKNLSIETDDVVSWCKCQIQQANSIVRNGKNWYAYVGNVIITINANSYTIITAHKNTEGKQVYAKVVDEKKEKAAHTIKLNINK
ncbi:MAG: DUF3781 domain-containing protein [Mediterranea sp.]|nr:DUF3781 domain-containing protein [Mediterranea sp.]